MRGKLADPTFRTERARKAAAASHGAAGVITRFLRVLPTLTPEQIETIRRALPPVGQANRGHVQAVRAAQGGDGR